MSLNDKMKYQSSEEEAAIWNQCMEDCFWYRSLPAAAIAGKPQYLPNMSNLCISTIVIF